MAAITDPLNLGIDVDCGPDGLSPTFGLIAGTDTLGQAIYRRFTTQRGLLSFHPGDGKDLRQFLSDGFSPQRIFSLKSDLEQEALKDERVDQVQVTVSFNSQTMALTLTIYVYPKDATTAFKLVLLVTQLSVELLSED